MNLLFFLFNQLFYCLKKVYNFEATCSERITHGMYYFWICLGDLDYLNNLSYMAMWRAIKHAQRWGPKIWGDRLMTVGKPGEAIGGVPKRSYKEWTTHDFRAFWSHVIPTLQKLQMLLHFSFTYLFTFCWMFRSSYELLSKIPQIGSGKIGDLNNSTPL